MSVASLRLISIMLFMLGSSLLHCAYACELWSFVFCLFGVSWVIPARVIDVLAWGGQRVIWDAVPLCLMWLLWRERNRRPFEDSERSSVELKFIFLRALCDWINVFSSTLDFVDFCYPC